MVSSFPTPLSAYRRFFVSFNARDEVIVENRVTYVMTRIEGRWGIQARFGLDSFDPDADVSSMSEAALGAVERLLEGWRRRDFESAGAVCNFPVIAVGVGSVRQLEDGAALAAELARPTVAEAASVSAEAVESGRRGVNVAARSEGGDGAADWRGVFLVTDREGHWGVEAVSLIE